MPPAVLPISMSLGVITNIGHDDGGRIGTIKGSNGNIVEFVPMNCRESEYLTLVKGGDVLYLDQPNPVNGLRQAIVVIPATAAITGVATHTGEVIDIVVVGGNAGANSHGTIRPDNIALGVTIGFNKDGVKAPTVFGPALNGERVRFQMKPPSMIRAINVERLP